MKRPHLTQRGVFRSKYKWCKSGFIALQFTNHHHQPFIWEFANQHPDREFQKDVRTALINVGYHPASLTERIFHVLRQLLHR